MRKIYKGIGRAESGVLFFPGWSDGLLAQEGSQLNKTSGLLFP